jgi:hypothetical protein
MSGFVPETAVCTKRQRLAGHTRLPHYLEGKHGTIVRCVGRFALPDDCADGVAEPRRDLLFTVRFAARDVFGAEAQAGDCIYADLFESYLDSA